MTQEQRKTYCMKERSSFKMVLTKKLRGNCLYVQGQKHGSVTNFVFKAKVSPPETTSNATDSEPDSQWLSSALRNTHNVTPSQIPFIDSQNPNNSKPLQLDCVETSNNNYNNSNVSHPRIPTSDSNNNDYNSITCYYLNIRSIVNKLSAFQAHVYSSDFDVVCLSKTWLSDSLFDQEILPSNYNIYRNDRPSRGGGVMIATKDNIPVTAITPYLPSSNAFEILSIKLNLCKPIFSHVSTSH